MLFWRPIHAALCVLYAGRFLALHSRFLFTAP